MMMTKSKCWEKIKMSWNIQGKQDYNWKGKFEKVYEVKFLGNELSSRVKFLLMGVRAFSVWEETQRQRNQERLKGQDKLLTVEESGSHAKHRLQLGEEGGKEFQWEELACKLHASGTVSCSPSSLSHMAQQVAHSKCLINTWWIDGWRNV